MNLSAARTNPPMTKQMPNRKFWLMTARVWRESLTRNGSRRRSLFISAIVALWMATSLPAAPMAMPRSPAASAGASLTPSPTTATR